MFSITVPKSIILFFILLFSTLIIRSQDQNIVCTGLDESVEVLVDAWGVPHIYANTEHDLFYAQGYYAARDRLFQFEVWRRQATGTVAEWLGHRTLQRDIGARLFQFRGDIDDEMNHYHPRGALIIRAYVEGVNAYISYINDHPDELPLEFKLLNTRPQMWTPEVVVSRHQGLLGNISSELAISRMVATAGEDAVRAINYFHPKSPNLSLNSNIKKEWLLEDLLAPYHAFRRSLVFEREDLVADHGELPNSSSIGQTIDHHVFDPSVFDIGSNNWVVGGHKTASGYPMMANDPHRRQSTPSLRYMAHLVGPGWNVIGGGEPEIPGISIGHNDFGAWGLTVFRTDAEDLYFYELDSQRPEKYRFGDEWLPFKTIVDTIQVKDLAPHIVTHRYTIHGPVLRLDTSEGYVCAMRCGWLEVGGSPYLASLRMNQSTDFESFREGCNYSHIPGENMVWADRQGHIGWQAVGIAPIRPNTSGLVATWASDTSQLWKGYLPIREKPWSLDPKEGYWSSANQNVTPPSYPHWDAIGYSWSDPFRGDRLKEVLGTARKFTVADMAALQTDYLSIPARQLTPLLVHLPTTDSLQKSVVKLLEDWDYRLDPRSQAATIYSEWENHLRSSMAEDFIPEKLQPFQRTLAMTTIVKWLLFPDQRFGKHPVQGRDRYIQKILSEAIDQVVERLGPNTSQWTYGQAANKHIYLHHPLSTVVSDSLRTILNVGPAPRGGNSFTLNNSSSNLNQSHGASFKIIVDTKDWDECLATNSPGQSGDPSSPFYRNLFPIWAKDHYFPLSFSREKVERVVDHRLLLNPK